nr:cinnamoyl-CoA reductase 1-like [Ipomoea batatas]
MSGKGKVVCVTGASGYIASWLVKLLLEHGYTVKATVRNLNNPNKVAHLLALDGAKERLHLFEANLLEEQSFDPAIDGCECVFHTASPVSLTATKEELVDPALKGTLNVLRSCAKASSIKRVVITSSMATIMVTGKPVSPDVIMDETWFSDPKHCEETKSCSHSKQWYALSKTLAEEAAQRFTKENGIELVTLHPGLVIGPILHPTLSLSSEAIFNIIKEGKEALPNGIYRFVDVRDVALAHIKAFENPSASGRYCLVEVVTYSHVALNIVHKLFPSLPIPDKGKQELPFVAPYQVSKERAEALGVSFTPLEITLKDTVESFREHNLLSF